jgi:hypothetical protein
MVDNGVLPRLIAMMTNRECPQLQTEACDIITNIAYASSAHTHTIVEKQGIDAFMHLLYENSPNVIEQALWGLGNIAGDCPKCRDQVILKGGV